MTDRIPLDCVYDHDHDDDPDGCVAEIPWWLCRYYVTSDDPAVPTEPCSFGCTEEPACVTCEPNEGWQSDGPDNTTTGDE